MLTVAEGNGPYPAVLLFAASSAADWVETIRPFRGPRSYGLTKQSRADHRDLPARWD